MSTVKKKKQLARYDYERRGFTIDEIVSKYGYAKSTIKSYVTREGWQREPKSALIDEAEKASEYLSVAFNEDVETLRKQLFSKEGGNEIEEIEKLATIMMIVAKGGATTIEQSFYITKTEGEDETLKETFRKIQTVKPDPRAGLFYLSLSEKLATMEDVGEYETDEELETRYKGYLEKALKQREEFENRDIDG